MKLNEVELVKQHLNPKVCVVLEALYYGLTVKLADEDVLLAKTTTGGEKLIAVRREDVTGLNWSVEGLAAMCNRISDEDIRILKYDLDAKRYQMDDIA